MELLERDAELEALRDHLRRAAAGAGRLVFVGGEAGVGKTTLVDAFCRRSGGEVSVLRASCDALSTPGPLGPVRDLAPALGIDIDVDRSGIEGDRRDLPFRAVFDALAGRSGATVLVGEDAHWSDGASLDLIRFLARRVGALRVLLIVTYRDDEVGPKHPLRLLLGDLATAPTVHRLKVAPLSADAVRALAAGSALDPDALHRLTGGNPFFLTEVLAAGGAGVPATVGDAVLARAARLSPEARAVLDVAAVVGSSLTLDLLVAVAGPVFDATDECIARGLLRSADDALAFRHELAREAVHAAIAPLRCRLLHARVLAVLREAKTADREPARLAHHAEAAGDRTAVLEFATAAAAQAAALHAHREAAAQYARVLRVADALPEAEHARLLEGRGLACYLSDQAGEAIAARLAACAIWRRLRDPAKEGENLRWLSRAYWFDGRGTEAEEAAVDAIAVLEALPPGPELAMAYSNRAQLRMLADDNDAAAAWGERAIALAERFGAAETLVHALVNVGSARLGVEDGRGWADLERAVRLAEVDRFIDHAGRALTNLAYHAVVTFALTEAERRLATALAYATEHDLDNYRWYLLAWRTIVALHRGAWDEASADARALLRRPTLSPHTRIVALTALGRVLARRGQPEATAVLDEALGLAERTGLLTRLGPVRAARAEAALLGGDHERALAEAGAVRDLAFDRGNSWLKGEIASHLWRAGDRDRPTAGPAEPFAREIAGDWAGAAAAWRALGFPYDEGRVLAEGGDPEAVRQAIATFERLGARPAMAQAIRRLRTLGVRDVPSVPRGPRSSTRAHPAGLTRREAEVLALVADGCSNAEIADRLYLTPKTVAHHVSAILAKLGVHSRVEATRAAARLGIAVA